MKKIWRGKSLDRQIFKFPPPSSPQKEKELNLEKKKYRVKIVELDYSRVQTDKKAKKKMQKVEK